MQNVTILKEQRIPQELLDLCHSSLIRKKFNVCFADYNDSRSSLLQKLNFSRAILCCPGRHLADDLIYQLRESVELFQLWSSGFDKFNVKGCSDSNILVCNNGGANSRSVAEHTILLILAGTRGVWECMNRVKKGMWGGNRHGLDFELLYQKKIGIIGLGKIGKIVVEMLNGFGCQIFYYDIRRDYEFEKKYNLSYTSLDSIFEECDIISLHLHLNKSTERIISQDLLEKAKPGLRLINVSRAQLVDNVYALKALNNGRLSSFCADVFEVEPNLKNDELIKHPNFMGTPHTAGSTYDTYVSAINACTENIEKLFNNQKIEFIVNPEILKND